MSWTKVCDFHRIVVSSNIYMFVTIPMVEFSNPGLTWNVISGLEGWIQVKSINSSKDPGWIPSTHMATHNRLIVTPVPEDPVPPLKHFKDSHDRVPFCYGLPSGLCSPPCPSCHTVQLLDVPRVCGTRYCRVTSALLTEEGIQLCY